MQPSFQSIALSLHTEVGIRASGYTLDHAVRGIGPVRRRRALCYLRSGEMTGEDRSRSEQIRALIEEVDRVRSESERMTSHADRSMKNAFWPDRRRTVRMPPSPDRHNRDDDAA